MRRMQFSLQSLLIALTGLPMLIAYVASYWDLILDPRVVCGLAGTIGLIAGLCWRHRHRTECRAITRRLVQSELKNGRPHLP